MPARTLLVALALLSGSALSSALAATLERDWARVYNRPGVERALAIWPAPAGGVDIVADRDGELVYLQYDEAGNLNAERATGVGVGTMTTWARVFAADGAGGFVLAAQQDSSDHYGLVQLRVSVAGQVLWRNPPLSPILYPAAIEVANGRVHLGMDEDYYTTYDPSLLVCDLSTGAQLCARTGRGGYYQRITDLVLQAGGSIAMIGSGQCSAARYKSRTQVQQDECFTWIIDLNSDCSPTRTRYYPEHHYYGRLEQLANNDVLLTTTHPVATPIESASFALTWFSPREERIPVAHADSKDLMIGGCRAGIMESMSDRLVIAGEHDVGNGFQELILATGAHGLDLVLVRPNQARSYEALQLAALSEHIVLLGIESDAGARADARIVLLFSEEMVLQDCDVDDNLADPVGLAIGQDGGIYTAGAGSQSTEGIVVTKLVIGGGPSAAPEAATPRRSRLGMPIPNPAGSSVRIEYEVANESETTLEIYDPTGRLVIRLVDGASAPGKHIAEWNTHQAARGVYLVRFKSGGVCAVRKIVVTK